MPSSSALLLALLVAIAALPAAGHDMWIEPSTFAPGAGELVRLRLLVGHPGPEAEAVRRDPRSMDRFVLLDAAGEQPVVGLDGADPAGLARPAAPGPAVVVYQSRPASSVLPAARFDSYLREEGLDRVIGLRAARGERESPGRERYARSLKALLSVAGGAADDRPLGLPLELVAQMGPFSWRVGRPVSFQLLWQGEPLPGALVEAVHLGEPGRLLAGRSDPSGGVSFSLPAAGPWLLTAVHMVPAEGDPEADWYSVWTSLTFELPEN